MATNRCLTTVISCILLIQFLSVQGKKSEEIGANNQELNLQSGFSNSFFHSPSLKSLIHLSAVHKRGNLPPHPSKLRDGKTTHVDSSKLRTSETNLPQINVPESQLFHSRLYLGIKTTSRGLVNYARKMSVKEAQTRNIKQGNGKARVKRSGPTDQETDRIEEFGESSGMGKHNSTVLPDYMDHPLAMRPNVDDFNDKPDDPDETQYPIGNQFKDATEDNDRERKIFKIHALEDDSSDEDSSDEDSSNPWHYILPAILATLIISFVITLLMYRAQRNKVPPKTRATKSRHPSDRGAQEDENEAIELGLRGLSKEEVPLNCPPVNTVVYHPTKKGNLLAGCSDNVDREEAEEPMISIGDVERSSRNAIDYPPTRNDATKEYSSKRDFFSSVDDDDDGFFNSRSCDIDYRPTRNCATEDPPLSSMAYQDTRDALMSSPADLSYDTHGKMRSKNAPRAMGRSYEKPFQRQDSKASHSCTDEEVSPMEKIYIRIPPRQPSDNYIEAASSSTSVSSTKSISSPKLEWLTKNILTDAKNEASYYQSEISTQTVSNVEPLSNKTVFGTPWQFGGTFTKNGGVLQPENSDVSLTLVQKAIMSRDYVDIYGAVFTETLEIRKKFEITANETIITPLVEYHASGNYNFSRHVTIKLPHALPEDCEEESLKVYGFSTDEQGQVSVQLVPHRKKGNACWDQDVFWEFGSKDKYFRIWTSHFSGYFCTACESKIRLSSICARVFGSHVQIKSKRREIRIILYIWDRRLNIQDFLQRIIEQECDMDRQLLADQQIPLTEHADSDSHVILKMDTMGDEEDRRCWRHVMRPNTDRPLFKPLQVRKLYQIIHCCQQTDPLRIEWAMENVPDTVPSSVFQCCIDMLHTPESTTNFEQALAGADDDMRTFYVRDLVLSPDYPQSHSDKQASGVREAPKGSNLNQVLAKLSQTEAESMCEAFGIAKKDIGNFCTKFPSGDKIKHALVEECCRRVGPENFSQHLPEVLKKIGLTHMLEALDKCQISSGHLESQTRVKRSNDLETNGKPSQLAPESLNGRLAHSTLNGYHENGDSGYYKCLQKQMSDQSNEVFFQDDKPSNHYGSQQVNVQVKYPRNVNGDHNPSLSRQSSQSQRYYVEREPISNPLSSQSFSHRDNQYLSSSWKKQQSQGKNYAVGQKSSSSGSDSVLRGNSITSSDIAMPSLDCVSMEAQADSKEYKGLSKNDELEEFEEETFKKEVSGIEQVENRSGFPEIEEDVLTSRHGPKALSNRINNNSIHAIVSSKAHDNALSNGQNRQSSQKVQDHYRHNHSPNGEETFCKELYDTIV